MPLTSKLENYRQTHWIHTLFRHVFWSNQKYTSTAIEISKYDVTWNIMYHENRVLSWKSVYQLFFTYSLNNLVDFTRHPTFVRVSWLSVRTSARAVLWHLIDALRKFFWLCLSNTFTWTRGWTVYILLVKGKLAVISHSNFFSHTWASQ